MSSVPLGENLIPIQRGLTTSSTAIFIPFITQELFQTGAALYYGCGNCLNTCSRNALSLVGGLVQINRDICDGCMECVEHCYTSAWSPSVFVTQLTKFLRSFEATKCFTKAQEAASQSAVANVPVIPLHVGVNPTLPQFRNPCGGGYLRLHHFV